MKKLLLFFCFFTTIFCEESIPYEQIVFGGAPGGFVANCVDVITGNYVISETDWVVNGVEPIRIERRYLSKRARERFSGWEFFFKHLKAKRIILDKKEENYCNGRDNESLQTWLYGVEIPEKEGFSLTYEGTAYVYGDYLGRYTIRGEYPHALTNCYGKEVGSRHCAFRNRVCHDSKSDKIIYVDGGDGGRRVYKYCQTRDHDYYLVEERLPNGNKVFYEWKHEHNQYRLKMVKTTDGSGKKVYAWIRFHYEMDGEKYLKEIRVRTSDNQYLWYKVKNVKGRKETYWVLDAFESTCKPNEKFSYWGNKDTRYYVSNRSFPDGRELKIDYYVEGNNPLPRETVHVGKKDDKKRRVKQLSFPIGPGGALQRVYAFYHHPGKYKKKEGSTTVIDYYGGIRRFFYNKDFLLKRIQYQHKDGSFFSTEEMEWKEYDKEKGHWLRSKTLKSENGSPLRKIVYHYNDQGNVYLEELIGDHTGNGNRNETYQINRKFNDQSLVTAESDNLGKKVTYQYISGTDLVSQKFTYDQGHLKIREFFIYDGAVLRKQIIDDGVNAGRDDLSGVTERIILEFSPKTSGEFLDFPEVVIAKYWDKESNCERLLYKKKIEKYSPQGKPEKIIHYDADGEERYTLNFVYDTSGKLISETDPMGRAHQLQYDANDNIIYEKIPDEVYGKHIAYDRMNHPLNIKEQYRVVHHSYDALGRRTEDTHFRLTVIKHQYDTYGHPILDIYPPVKDESDQVKEPSVKRIYNAMGKVHKEIDPLGCVTETYYTCRGNPYLIIYPDGAEERFYYNLRGEVIKHVAPGKTTTEEARDFLGRVIQKKVFDKNQNLLSEESFIHNSFHCIKNIAPDGVETTFSFDGAGRKIKEETLDRVMTYHYDSLGREEKVIQNGERFFIKKYDLLNRIIEEKEEDQAGRLFSITTYKYDDFSNKIATVKEVQIGEAISRIFYDGFKREIKSVDPLGYETTINYDDYFVNDLGQKVLKKTTTSPKGIKTIEIFDALDRLVEFQKVNSEGRLLLTEKFSYDLRGDKCKQQSLFDEKKVVKTWKYDSRGRVLELNESGTKITSYTYTPDGLIQSITKPDGEVINYEYDGLGRQTRVENAKGRCHYTFKYNKMGYVIESKDEDFGYITKREYNHFGDLLHETLANKLSIDHTYDSLGRPKELIFADQSKVVYEYDPYHLRSVKRLDSSGIEIYQHTYDEYDKSHHLISEVYPGSIGPAHHQVDLLGRRIRTDSIYSTEIIEEIDSTGNVTKYLRDHNNEQEMMEYTYDDLDQLTSETGHFPHQYTYDAHYNRLQKDEEICDVDSLHQLLAHGETTHTYDPNGNRITTTKGGNEIFYAYDGFDRLARVISGSKAVRYLYDYWGRCVTRVYYHLDDNEWKASKIENFLFDGQNELGIYPLELRILGQGKGAEIGATIAIEKGNGFFVPIHDLFGNAIAAMDWDGACLESYRHSAYGEEKIFNGDVIMSRSDTNPWRYQSKRKMGGLINFGRRFYDPETGRWLSPDPKGFDEGPNLYQYLRNSPLLLFDLYGLSIEEAGRYSFKRCMKDVGYAYYYTVRRTYEGYATADPNMAFALANFGQALGNIISGNYERPVPTRSRVYTLEGKKLPDVEFLVMNGILNSKKDALSFGKLVQEELNGAEVKVLYNNTHGALDFIDFAIEKMGISTRVCDLFYNEVKSIVDSGKIAEIQLHSEAHAIANNGLRRFTPDQRSRISCNGYASADIIHSDLDGSVRNSLSGNDLVSFFANPVNCIGSAMINDRSVEFLKPRSFNPISEHMLMSPVNLDKIIEVNRGLREKYDLN